MQHPVRVLLYLIMLGQCGCSSFVALQQADAERLILLPPVEGPKPTLLKQSVLMAGRGQNQQFIAVIRVQPNRVKVVALLPTGQQLFYLEYDGEILVQENYSSADIPSEEILALIQFSLWPLSSIKQHYTKEAGWVVESSPEQRALMASTGVFVSVNYQSGVTIVENYHHDYRLMISPLDKKDI